MGNSTEKDHLAHDFDRAVGGIEQQPGDVQAVLRRGRRRRRVRRVVSGVALLSALIGIGLVGPSIVERWERPLQAVAPSEQVDRSITTHFTFLALDASGLLNLSGDFFEIEDIHSSGDGWLVDLQPRYCVATQALETCVKRPEADAFLRLEVINEALHITGVSGDVDPAAQASLKSFRRELNALNPSAPFWHFSTPVIHGPDGNHVEAVLIWTGEIPVTGYAERCHAQLLDDGGQILWESKLREIPPPAAESGRVGGTVGFGPIPREFRTTGSSHITCSPVRGSGWQVSDSPGNPQLLANDDEVSVQVELVWPHEPYLRMYTRCVASVFNEANELIATGDYWLTGPLADEEPTPPVVKTVLIRIDGTEPISAMDATVDCNPVSELDYETRDG